MERKRHYNNIESGISEVFLTVLLFSKEGMKYSFFENGKECDKSFFTMLYITLRKERSSFNIESRKEVFFDNEPFKERNKHF